MNASENHGGPALAGPLFRLTRQGLDGLDLASQWLVIGTMALMVVIVVVQVFLRYVLSSGFDWSAELARLAFVWAMFLAIPHGIRRGVHVGIDVLTSRLPDTAQELIFRFCAVLGAVLMAAVFWYALKVTIDTWSEMMPTVNLTSAVYYIAVLIAALHSFLHLSLLVWGGRSTWD